MQDRDLYATILGLTSPWKVTAVDIDSTKDLIDVHVEATGASDPAHGSDRRQDHGRHAVACAGQLAG